MAAARVSSSEQPGGARVRPRFARLSDRALARLFLTPTMLLLLAIAIFPLIWSLYLSFTKYSVIKDVGGPTAIGLANYQRLLNDPEGWQRFSTTAGFGLPSVVVEL